MSIGFINERAAEAAEEPEALPAGAFAGLNPGSELVLGTTEDIGEMAPSDCGAGAGANVESLMTEEGGAISGGNCCTPAYVSRR